MPYIATGVICAGAAFVFFWLLFRRGQPGRPDAGGAEKAGREEYDRIKKADGDDLVNDSPHADDHRAGIGAIKAKLRERIRNRLKREL